MRFAKKRGQVGGKRVGERLQFGFVTALQAIQIIGEVFDARSPQTPCQTAIYELLLVFAERDAGVLVDHLADTLKILIGENEFAGMSSVHAVILTESKKKRAAVFPNFAGITSGNARIENLF